MFAERVDPLAGTMLGKDYRVLEPIGAGGMAVVYLVEHQTLLKRFAAKVLSSELASSMEARARFTQEAHAASQLDHENIVSISDFGVTADQRPFFVMELLRGQTLDQRLGDAAMTSMSGTQPVMRIEEVVAVSVPVARALAHAHAEGIVHRDVKPENIFLVQRSQGRWGVKVVDFGIARTPINPKLTNLSETLGSPLFMAPEMIRGEDDDDARTDIYSFGVLLYLMLCGRLPFYDENLLKVMQMHLSVPVPPLRTVNPALSAELAAVVERALAKDRDDRYPSMDALLLDLEAALPAGADRLLIEAQSGTTLGDTPFASALSLTRLDAQRLARPPSSPPAPPPITPRPRAPRRSRAMIALGGLAVAAIGGVGWLRIAGHPTAATAAAIARKPVSAAVHDGTGARAPAAIAAPTAVAPPPSAPPPSASQPSASLPPARPSTRRPPRLRPGAGPGASPGTPSFRAMRQGAALSDSTGLTGSDSPGAATDPGRVATDAPATPAPSATGAATPAGTPDSMPPSPGTLPPSPDTPPPSSDTPPSPGTPPSGAAPEPPAAQKPPSAARSTPGSFDAVPEIASFAVHGSLSSSLVRRSVERVLPALRACYGAAARADRATPAVDLPLSFEIDENSLATHVAIGGVRLGSLARCAAGIASQIRTSSAPDIGTVKVTAVIHFRPS